MAELEGGGMETTSYDPFGQDVAQAQLIVLMKIYDVLFTMLTDANPEAAAVLDNLHSNGIVGGLGPNFSHFAPRHDETAQGHEQSDEE